MAEHTDVELAARAMSALTWDTAGEDYRQMVRDQVRPVLSTLSAAGRLRDTAEDMARSAAFAAGVAEGRRLAVADIRRTLDAWERLGKLPQSYLDGVADAAGVIGRGGTHR